MTVTPAPTTFDPAPWSSLLEEVARRHEVPGMVAGVLRIDPATGWEQRFVAHAGMTNLGTAVPNDRHTVCQIGSVTKVVTGTMIMQLREEGKLDLDTPVDDLLPGVLPDSGDTKITVRHLLTHTSGLDGDLFTDTGRGDDCLERYVAGLGEAEMLFAPGTGWSYCNSGFVLLGRIIEVLDERGWDASLKARIIDPLGLTTFLTLPEDMLAHRVALGHLNFPGTPGWSPTPSAMITRSMGPAGLITSNVDDLLTFGAGFLRHGDTGIGNRLLSDESVAEMTAQEWVLDPAADQMAPEWALGWMRDEWDGHRVYWHGGTTIGQNAWFQVLPDDGLAFVVFCNGGAASAAAEEVYGAFAAEFAGALPPQALRPSGPASETDCDDRWLGRYSDANATVTVRRRDEGGLEATVQSKGDAAHPDGQVLQLYPSDRPLRFLARPEPAKKAWVALSFTEIEGAPTAYLGIRALPQRTEQTDVADADAGTDAADAETDEGAK